MAKVVHNGRTAKETMLYILFPVLFSSMSKNVFVYIGLSFGRGLSSYHHRGASRHYRSAMRGAVAHACGRSSANHHGGRAFHYRVRRTYADAHIAYDGCRHFPYQYVRHTGSHYGTAHMGYRRGKRRGLHGAGVHIGYSCCWRHDSIYNLTIYNLLFIACHLSLSLPSHLLRWSGRLPRVPPWRCLSRWLLFSPALSRSALPD